MNVYQCNFRGMLGYCCRNYNGKWMFVPELGQVSGKIIKNIALHEIEFTNRFAKAHELGCESPRSLLEQVLNGVKQMFMPSSANVTIGGKLFAPIA